MINLTLPSTRLARTPLSRAELYGASWCLSRHIHGHLAPVHWRLPRSITWVHGWVPNSEDQFVRLLAQGAHRNRLNLVATESDATLLSQNGYESLAVGLPFVYARSPNPQRLGESILLVPAHSARGMPPTHPSAWLQQMETAFDIRNRYQHIYILLHQREFVHPEVTAWCQKTGYGYLLGGHPRDLNSLDRLSQIFNSFETVYGQEPGSFLPMAALCGARVGVTPFPTHQDDARRALALARAPQIAPMRKAVAEVASEVFVPPSQAIDWTKNAGEAAGSGNIVDPSSPILRGVFNLRTSIQTSVTATIGSFAFGARSWTSVTSRVPR